MNICILKESLCIGGTERSAANISKILCEDHDVSLALYDGNEPNYSYGGKLIDFKLPPRPTYIGKIFNTILREKALRKTIKKEKPDILYTFTAIGNYQTKLKYKNTIKIISARDFDKMSHRHEEYHKALLNSNAMICNSEYLRSFYSSKYPEDKDKVYTIYNYINTDEICAQSSENTEFQFDDFLKNHPKTLVSVGRFCKEKGFEYLLEAFANARVNNEELGLVLIGDGDYKQKYLKVIEQLHIGDHVYFTGSQKNPYKYMKKCSCFVLSSLSEGFPNVLAEAMALSLPVIAVNCFSGPAEILRTDGDYGAVTDRYLKCDFGIITPRITGDNNVTAISQLGEAMAELLGDSDMMKRYAVLSEKRVNDFSKVATREKLNSVFTELINRGKTK